MPFVPTVYEINKQEKMKQKESGDLLINSDSEDNTSYKRMKRSFANSDDFSDEETILPRAPIIHKYSISETQKSPLLPAETSNVSDIQITNLHSLSQYSQELPHTSQNLIPTVAYIPASTLKQNNQNCSCSDLQLQILKRIEKKQAEHTKLLRQHTEILNLLLVKQKSTLTNVPNNVFSLPLDFPVNLPMSTIDEIALLNAFLLGEENFSHTVSYLTNMGGNGLRKVVQRLLSFLLSHSLAIQLNWKGRGEKHCFQQYEYVNRVINQVAKNNVREDFKIDDVENCVKNWLRFAPDRYGGRGARKHTNSVNTE